MGLLFFVIFINDLFILFDVRLFDDDCLFYWKINLIVDV